MDGATGIAVVLGLNLLVTVFSAGKLYQKVGDLSKHIDGLEKKFENIDSHLDHIIERVAKIEGKLGKG